MIFSSACNILNKLRDAGHEAYFAGGCVRDMLLNLEPHDIDIATSALPQEVEKLFPRTVAVGAQFGVIIVLEKVSDHILPKRGSKEVRPTSESFDSEAGQRSTKMAQLENDIEIQVATFRQDGSYRDGRHPTKVSFTNAEEDAKRRDFTINGLFYDPIKKKVFDYVNGHDDLSKKMIRAIGNPYERFEEDKLRLLRAIRFSTTLGFQIEPITWKALCELAPKILVVSAERIRDELQKIFLSHHRLQGFDLLDQSGLLRILLPEIKNLKGCEQPPEFHPEGDVFIHTRLMLKMLPAKASLPLVLSVLFHDIGKPATRTVDEKGKMRFYAHDQVGTKMAGKILHRLRFSNEIIEAILPAVRLHMTFKDVQKMRLSTLRRMMSRPTFKDELELHRVDCASSHGMLDNYFFLQQKQEEFANTPLIPPPLITGQDLIALGMKPGPAFGKILQAVKDAQLENKMSTRGEALALARIFHTNSSRGLVQRHHEISINPNLPSHCQVMEE